MSSRPAQHRLQGQESSWTGASSDEERDDVWDDWEDEEELGVRSLFDDGVFPSVEAAMQHDQRAYGFHLREWQLAERLSGYEVMQAVNLLRHNQAEDLTPDKSLGQLLREAGTWRNVERYLQPVVENDPMLQYDWHDQDWDGQADAAGLTDSGAAGASSSAAASQQRAVPWAAAQALADDNRALQAALQQLQALMLGDDGGPSLGRQHGRLQRSQAAVATRQRAERDQGYFDSYSGLGIHRDMLADLVRTEAYRTALEANPQLVEGATVLDVGCGTGILSMFAARAGAKQAIGVDGSARMVQVARGVAAANAEQLNSTRSGGASSSSSASSAALCNGHSGEGLVFISGEVEKLQSLPVDKVDVIVSEWMGYCLLFEGMLETVLHARDRWLRPGGAILPDCASIHMAAASPAAADLDFWRDVQGFSFEPVHQEALGHAWQHAGVLAVKAEHLVSEAACVHSMDLATMQQDDAWFTTPFELQAAQQAQSQTCGAVVLWFDVTFTSRFCKQQPVVLSTSPLRPRTHWQHTVLVLRHPFRLQAGSPALKGTISMARSQQHRGIDISLSYTAAGEPVTQIYSLC